MPIDCTCIRCKKPYKVTSLINWKYSSYCDHCILAMQPYDKQSAMDARADARDEFNESNEVPNV